MDELASCLEEPVRGEEGRDGCSSARCLTTTSQDMDREVIGGQGEEKRVGKGARYLQED